MGRLSEGMARLAERQLELNGVSVTYTRGATVLTLTAVLGRTRQPTDTANNQTNVRQTHRDFLLDPSIIVFAGVVSKPLKGDRIGWNSQVWEAIPVVDGEQCWTPCEEFGHMIRVHTVQES